MSTVQTIGGAGDSRIVFRKTSNGLEFTLYYNSVTDELSITKNNVEIFSTDGTTAAFRTNVSINPGYSYLGGKNMGQMGYQAADITDDNTYGVVTINTQGAWTPFPYFTNAPSVAVRVTSETIPNTTGRRFVVLDAGIYMVYVYVSCQVQGNSDEYLSWGFSVNGNTAQPCEIVMREIDKKGIMNAYPMCLGLLPANGTVELQVQNVSSNRDVLVAAARFQVIRY